jgi:hypothetical protein
LDAESLTAIEPPSITPVTYRSYANKPSYCQARKLPVKLPAYAAFVDRPSCANISPLYCQTALTATTAYKGREGNTHTHGRGSGWYSGQLHFPAVSQTVFTEEKKLYNPRLVWAWWQSEKNRLCRALNRVSRNHKQYL